jgi:hypothetical protein
MAINPFEPPRTTDLDADPTGEGSTVPAEAVRELVQSAPWVRASIWLTGFSVAIGLFAALVLVIFPRAPATTAASTSGNLVVQLGGIVVTAVFLGLYVAYHQRLQRLARGETGALAEVIDGQRRLFKTMGVLILVSVPLVLVGIVVASLSAKQGVGP